MVVVMSKSYVACARCGAITLRENGHINRAKKNGNPLYCGKVCAGIGRQTQLTESEKKERKRLYDIEYREKNSEALKVGKAAWFKATYDPKKAAIERKKRMPKHVEYCQRPEYKEYKQNYDREYRAKKEYGEFWQCFLLLLSIETEVAERATPLEIASQNGTLNKRQTRKREYERAHRN